MTQYVSLGRISCIPEYRYDCHGFLITQWSEMSEAEFQAILASVEEQARERDMAFVV